MLPSQSSTCIVFTPDTLDEGHWLGGGSVSHPCARNSASAELEAVGAFFLCYLQATQSIGIKARVILGPVKVAAKSALSPVLYRYVPFNPKPARLAFFLTALLDGPHRKPE